MARAFKLPDLGEGIHEAEVVAILVSEGDRIEEGQPFLEVETDKARVEIPSPYSGTVEEILVKVDETVRVGSVLMTFGDGAGAEEPGSETASTNEVRTPHPRSSEVPGELSGVSAAPREAVAAPAGRRESGPVPASPATRRLARELGVDLSLVPGRGPAGLVTADDVRAFAEKVSPVAEAAQAGGTPSPEDRAPVLTPADELPDFSRWGTVDREPLRSVRKATAKHMALAWSQVPHVNHQESVDITDLEGFRKANAPEVAQQGGKLTLTVFVIKAVVAALKAFPRFNASLDPSAEEMILKRYFHIGVAADTDRGLIVPVVRDVDRKSVTELSVELVQVVERARAGATPLEEMQGGTFTITNIGALGGTGFSPIVNYPQVAILGMGRARLQPVVRGDLDDYEIVPRLMMPLVLAFDHRLLDGAEAARFVGAIAEGLENPARLWLRI